MVMSSAIDELNLRLAEYRAITKLAQDAGARAEQQPDGPFARALGLPDLGEKTADRRKGVRRYFDALQQTLFDQFFVALVATFERWAFVHLTNAVGEARRAVGDQYSASVVFAPAAERFVKS